MPRYNFLGAGDRKHRGESNLTEKFITSLDKNEPMLEIGVRDVPSAVMPYLYRVDEPSL